MIPTLYDTINLYDYQTLLLDRDGVINRLRPNDYVKTWDEFEFLPGILKAIARWSMQCKYIIIVTNQRGVGKGLMSEENLLDIHRSMVNEIEKQNGRIDQIYYCTDVNSNSPNRKPNIGMLGQILDDFPDIDLDKTIMIGDSESDILFANNCNIKYLKI